MPNHTDLTNRLQQFLDQAGCGGKIGGPLKPMLEGHAGFTYSFSLETFDGARRDYVLKRGPEGVRRSGSTDIFRQAELLRSLQGSGLPVPEVPWASPDEAWIGAPFVVLSRLPGRNFLVWEPHAAFNRQLGLTGLWQGAAELLAKMHRAGTMERLRKWESITSIAAELDRWARLIRHTSSSEDREHATRVAKRLRDLAPGEGAIGLVHGDFQPGNILYEDGRVTGLIDWDLATLGPQGQDLGWLLMMADGPAWAASWQPIQAPPIAELVDAYTAYGGVATADIDWHRAFACFRMAVIIGLNLKLHRNGNRVDPIWDRFESSAATLLNRALTLTEW